MKCKVLNNFREKEHDYTFYAKGETYPKEGFKANKKRVSYLQDIHPDYGVRFLDVAADDEVEPKKTTSKKKSDAK